METIFESLKASLPIFQKIFPFDCNIVVADQERFLFSVPGKLIKFEDAIGKQIHRATEFGRRFIITRLRSTLFRQNYSGFHLKVSEPRFLAIQEK